MNDDQILIADVMLVGATQAALGERLATGRWCPSCLGRLQAAIEVWLSMPRKVGVSH
jgi:hypothetical protein